MGDTVTPIPRLREYLVTWFLKTQRDLPWRHCYDPYQIWISEVMLQQTQVETVIPYFNRWIRQFPNIDHLAVTEESVLLKYWEGLGYYSRAKNILKTAILLKEANNSRLPENRKSLQELPGIGPYTAGAISSIAFRQREPIIDGNIQRVFSRLFLWDKIITSRRSAEFINQKSQQLLKEGDPRIINQSIMELGALICTKNKPKCNNCPVSSLCSALKYGRVAELPQKRKAVAIIKREMVYLVFNFEDKYYIEQQSEGALWASLWSFPFFDGGPEQDTIVNKTRNLFNPVNYALDDIRKLKSFKHAATKYRIAANPVLVKFTQNPNQLNLEEKKAGRWVSLIEMLDFALTKAGVVIRKQLEIL